MVINVTIMLAILIVLLGLCGCISPPGSGSDSLGVMSFFVDSGSMVGVNPLLPELSWC